MEQKMYTTDLGADQQFGCLHHVLRNSVGIIVQQDGTRRTANETKTFLRLKLHGRIISQNGDVSWSHRSCDLNPLKFFSGENFNEKLNTNDLTTVQLYDIIMEMPRNYASVFSKV